MSGRRWSDDDDRKLAKLVHVMDDAAIAKVLGRTACAVTWRRKHILCIKVPRRNRDVARVRTRRCLSCYREFKSDRFRTCDECRRENAAIA